MALLSVPTQRSSGLVLDHPRLEEVALLLEIDHLAHPRERIGRAREERLQADLLAAAVSDEAQGFLVNGRGLPKHAARPWGLRGAGLGLDGPAGNVGPLLSELRGPQGPGFLRFLAVEVD